MHSIRSTLRGVLRLAKRLLWYSFLLTLPLTVFPLINGLYAGVIFHFWTHSRGQEHTEALIREIEWQDTLSYWNVPGAQSIHDFMDNRGPFFIPRLKTLEFVEKFELSGLGDDPEVVESQGIDQMASLDNLVRCVHHHPDAPTEYWVYISESPEWSHDPWDEAFDTLLQQTYTRPFPPSRSLYYLDCTRSSFLCGVWGVRRPSLVHLSISNTSLAAIDESTDPEQQEDLPPHYHSCSREVLHPVTAHVIEFPLEDDEAAALFPRNTLPTPYLQLRTILFDLPPSALPDLFSPWDQGTQLIARFNDHIDDLQARRGSIYHYLDAADDWYTEHILKAIFGKSVNKEVLGPVQSWVFTLSLLLCELAHIPFRIAWEIYAWYFGLGWDGQPVDTGAFEEQNGNAGGGGGGGRNMFDDMMGDFWNFVERNLSAQASEDAAFAAVTEDAAAA